MFFSIDDPLENNTLKLLSDFLSLSQNQSSSMSLTECHGFITAIITAPNMIKFTEWSRPIFGDNVTFQSRGQEYLLKNLLIQIYNQTVLDLVSTEAFEPFLFNGTQKILYKERTNNLIKEWCRGYFYGSQMDDLWTKTEDAMNYLVPFVVLGNASFMTNYWRSRRNFFRNKRKHKSAYQENLPSTIKVLYNFWAECRSQRAFYPKKEKIYVKIK